MLFDTHAHYDDDRFDGMLEELMNSMHQYGVEKIITCGCDGSSSKAALTIAEKYPFVNSSSQKPAKSLQFSPEHPPQHTQAARCFDRFCRSYMRYMMQRKGHGHQPSRRFPLYKKQRGGKSAALFE